MGTPRFEAICYDAGNTLLYCDPSPAEIYAEQLSRHGRPVTTDETGPAFREAWTEMQRRTAAGMDRYSSVAGGEREWWGDFVREVVHRLDHEAAWEPLLDDLYAAFSRAEVWKSYPDTLPTLRSLLESKITLAVISNWDRRLGKILHDLELETFFEVITVSAIEGVEKPSTAIFERTLERLGAAPSATVHVGDSPREDYQGAASAGLTPLLIDRRGLFSDLEYRRIDSLTAILDFVV
jgi:putative hydrolase of the HAD superfamily